MAPETFETIDLTELAELIEDEDSESDEPEVVAPTMRATPSAGEIAMA